MRNAIRTLLVAASATALVNCSDASRGTVPNGKSRASLAIVPRFADEAVRASAALAQAGVAFDRVRIVIVRPPSDTLKDTTITFSPTAPPVTLELSLAAEPNETLRATVMFAQGTTVLFTGTANVVALPPTAAGTSAKPVEVKVTYTGPGATATRVSIVPGSGVYSAGTTTQFTAKAFDSGNTELANTPIVWSLSDEVVATISATGLLTPKGTRGFVRVRAFAANGVADSATVALALPAVGLRVVQGAAQRGAPGSQLPLPVIIEAVDADGLRSPGTGLTATFSAVSGGSITPTTSAFDANGRVQATMTLGTKAGSVFLYTATAGGFSVTWGEIAAVGPPTHFVASGATTFAMTAGVIPSPVPTLRVADALENSVTGVALKVTINKADPAQTQVAQFTVPSDTIGLLEVYRVAPTLAGTYSLKVEADPALSIPPITYTVTIEPGPAAKLAFKQQPTDVKVNQAVVPAVQVVIQDQFGNTVTSATSTIALAVDPTTGSGVSITGQGSISSVNGVATFSSLTFGQLKAGIKITAAGASLPPVLSAAFNITP